ncbi:MAG: winged helix-turn-helix domain-containing protein [Pseudomonadota bacterium]
MSQGAPPFFDNQNGISGEVVQHIIDLMPALDSKHREILSFMALAGQSDGTHRSIQEIADYIGIKPPAIRNRLKVLVSAGIAEHHMISYEGCRRPVSLFRLRLPELSKLATALDTTEPSLPTLPESHEIHTFSNELFSAIARDENPFFVDNLFCTVLFSALPVSRKLTYEPLDVTVDWYGQNVPVTLRPLAERPVCKAEDLRFYIGLITYLSELVQNEGVPRNVLDGGAWTIKISDVLNVMGLPTSGGNTKTALASFERLASTNIELASLPETVMERYGFEHAEQAFQALGNFGIYQKTAKVNKSTFITFSLPPTINDSLIKYGRDFFKLSPNALRYNEAYFLRIHLWAKRRLGQNINAKTIDHRRAWKEISPGIAFKEHLKRFNDVIWKFVDYVDSLVFDEVITEIQGNMLVSNRPSRAKDTGSVTNATINLFGYILRITDTHIHITRDISDPYVGIGRDSVVLTGKEHPKRISSVR